MQRMKATTLALLTTGALALGACRDNPPSTTVQGPPDSAPQPVPTPQDNSGAPAATGSPSDTGTSGATGTGPTAGGADAVSGTTPQGGTGTPAATTGSAGTAAQSTAEATTSPSGTGSRPDNALAGGTSTPAPSVADGASQVNPSALPLVDQNFLTTAAASGLLEVAAARAAASKASSTEVKAFAGTLLKDHTAANGELRALAARKNVNLPTEIGAGQTPTLEALTNASGAAFDRQFLQTMGISEHQSAISLFERAAREAKDTEVRAFAEKTLPKLREHLATARKLAGS